jgi:hypothetical protein
MAFLRIASCLGVAISAMLMGNPLKSGCFKQGWVKVVSVGIPTRLQASGLCEHSSGRVFVLQAGDYPIADALWCDPIDQSYYLRDGNRRIVLDAQIRASMVGYLEENGTIASSYWTIDPQDPHEPVIWQDWESPLAMSTDSRIVISESGKVLWVPEFNGIVATPISWTNLGWVTLRFCAWNRSIERIFINIMPFSAAHNVLAQSSLREGGLYLSRQACEKLVEQSQLVWAPLAAPRTKLQGCHSTSNPSTCE